MHLYSLIVTGPEERCDDAINALLEARYDVRSVPLIAYGDDPYSAAHAVEALGWRVEDRAAILDDVPLDIAAQMKTATFSGPAATAREARELLTQAGWFVMIAPVPIGRELQEGEAFLSIDVGDPDAGSVIEHLGWHHRATTAHLGSAKRIGGQG